MDISLISLIELIPKLTITIGALYGGMSFFVKSQTEIILENILIRHIRKSLKEIYRFIFINLFIIVYPILLFDRYYLTANLINYLLIFSLIAIALYALTHDLPINAHKVKKNKNTFMYNTIKILNRLEKIKKYTLPISMLLVLTLFYVTQSLMLSFVNHTLHTKFATGFEILLSNGIDYHYTYALYPTDLWIRNVLNIKIVYLLLVSTGYILPRMLGLLIERNYISRKPKQLITLYMINGDILSNYEYINSNLEAYIVKNADEFENQYIFKNQISKVILQNKFKSKMVCDV